MTDKFRIVYSLVALDDLKSIYKYISEKLLAESVARKQVDRIRKSIRDLDLFPKKHKVVDWEPWKSLKMHQMSVDNYVIYYLINDEDNFVTITRIFYGGRNIEEIISDKNSKV